jgi:hypothetical protein
MLRSQKAMNKDHHHIPLLWFSPIGSEIFIHLSDSAAAADSSNGEVPYYFIDSFF